MVDLVEANLSSRTMRKQRLSILLILGLILIIFIAACSPQPSDCYREDVFCVGLVTAYGDVENHGLNQITWKALQGIEVQAQMARLDNIESVDARDWQKNIRFFRPGNGVVLLLHPCW